LLVVLAIDPPLIYFFFLCPVNSCVTHFVLVVGLLLLVVVILDVVVFVVVAVSGLPYPAHTQSNYTKVEGACAQRFYNRSEELSPSTCRYLCDTAPEKRPCQYGFTYYDITPEDALLGTTVSTCRFLIGNCRPSRRKRVAYTYFRQQMTATTVGPS